ncbi:flagellar hook-basal body protein [Cohnella sp. CFH 77786]|uniref:flagellar hook-basal body protein n=1 Tax=Cohnella sp. CFH 77786 TaxID=2662265 RepID=UPI001C60D16C|nr:flagellar hook-basal body protein [Cohnella sp. CFH 77786]MBW5445908.1 flagellar hook-basal body protein [Cohnella sp. CFH 77786]
MLRGLYTAASGMMAQQRRHDTVTNNIANLNTPGYKAMNAMTRAFPEMLISAMGGENVKKGPIGKLTTGVFAEENRLSFVQGDLFETYRPQDLALVSDIRVNGAVFDDSGKYVDPNGNVTYQPQAFFTVQSPDGERQYTRDGSFKTAQDGTLLTADGVPVLGANGQPIVINGSWEDIAVTSDGILYSRALNAPLPGSPRLMLTVVNNPNDLTRQGNGRFRYEGDPAGIRQLAAGDPVQVRQGFLERSNVDSAQSMVDIMSALRAYEANQKVIQFYDSSLQKAVNEVGRV